MKSFIEHKSSFYEKHPDGYVTKPRARAFVRAFFLAIILIAYTLFLLVLTGCAASVRVKGTTDRTTQQHYEYEYGADYSKYTCIKTYSIHKKV